MIWPTSLKKNTRFWVSRGGQNDTYIRVSYWLDVSWGLPTALDFLMESFS